MQTNTARATGSRSAFTLTEILVAVGVLLAVVVVTGRIFKVATDVTASGQATIDIMQEASAIEARIRQDLSQISREGFLAIHSVEAPNDINITEWESGGSQGEEPGLLNPLLPADAVIRCDQLSFFVDSPVSSQVHSVGTALGTHPSAQGQTAFVTYGHGLQFPYLKPYTPEFADMAVMPVGSPPPGYGHDPDIDQIRADGGELLPWRYDNPGLDESQWLPTVYTDYSSSVSSLYGEGQIPPEQRYINGTQPDARQWVLARQAILLADDDQNFAGDSSKRQYLNNVPSAMSIFPNDARLVGGNALDDGTSGLNADPPVIAYGRVDVAATPIDQVRELLQTTRSPSDPRDFFMRRCMHAGEAGDYDQINEVDADEDGLPDMEPRNVLEGNLFSLPGNPYLDQRFFIKNAVQRPRVERVAPGLTKVDQSLVNHALGSACSSFMVEWTYAEGTGEAFVPNPIEGAPDQFWHGVHYSPWEPLLSNSSDPGYSDAPWLGQRWFGLRNIDRGVMPYSDFVSNFPPVTDDFVSKQEVKGLGTAASFAIDPYAIDREQPTFGSQPPYGEYWATFGLNQDQPNLPLTERIGQVESYQVDRSFTPWPSAIRITMTINDPQGRLDQGQVYQFVVEMPEQARGNYAGGI